MESPTPGEMMFHVEHVDQLGAYADLLRRYAPRLNLVAMGDLERLEERHIADSLTALPLVDAAPDGPAVDVGSGAGLPGIPLAISRPGRTWRLIEPRAKRVAFLEEVVRELDLNVEILAMTAEQAADRTFGASHAVATARALAAPEVASRLIRPLLAPGGRGILFVRADTPLPEGAEVAAPGLAIISP